MKNKYAIPQTSLGRMRAAGCPMPEKGELEPPPGLKVEINQSELTRARDQRLHAEFVFAVRISNNSYNNLAMMKMIGILPWEARLIWLVDPVLSRTDNGPYRLPSGTEFDRESVLNHRLGPSAVIKSGETLDGILLGIAGSAIPRYFPCQREILTKLVIVDQFGIKHRSGLDVLVDRTATAQPQRPRRQRSTLYDPVDYEVFDANRRSAPDRTLDPNWLEGSAFFGTNEEK